MARSERRLLIRGDNWRYRSHIAQYGEYPNADYFRSHIAFYAGIGRSGSPRLTDWRTFADVDETLPHGNGYGAVAYLEVYAGDAVQLSRNEWDAADATVCATCAESGHPDVDSEWGYYPLLESLGEIGGTYAPLRCDRCGNVIIDADTLILEFQEPGADEPEREQFSASQWDGAARQFHAERERIAQKAEPGEFWFIRLLDAERKLSEHETGERWPVETVQYQDSRFRDVARHYAAGQSTLPGFPAPPQSWEILKWESVPEYWKLPIPETFGSPSYVPPLRLDEYGDIAN